MTYRDLGHRLSEFDPSRRKEKTVSVNFTLTGFDVLLSLNSVASSRNTPRNKAMPRMLLVCLIVVVLPGMSFADDKNGKTAPPFKLSPKLVEQARRAAAETVAHRLENPSPPSTGKSADVLPETTSEAVLQAMRDVSLRDQQQARRARNQLAKFPTPEAVDFLVQSVQSQDAAVREPAVETLRLARWGVPLLIGLLDDTAYSKPSYIVTGRYAEQNWKITMPASHDIYERLALSLRKYNLPGKSVGMTEQRSEAKQLQSRFKIDREIPRVKEWWKIHGDAFLKGREVPDPVLIYVTDGLK